LFCGTLKPLKGIHYLLDAWARFIQEDDVDATLVIVGEGPERAKLERRASDAGLSNVRFLGHLQRERLPAIYHAADVFVFPTLDDCWALAVNEAMVAGLPVINSKYAGSADLISDGVNGWVIDPLNEVDLVRGLRSAWDARHERATMSMSVRNAVAGMTVPTVAERIRSVVNVVAIERARSNGQVPT
jgi:glycosyltransferase involved in cell wall biosynthesis